MKTNIFITGDRQHGKSTLVLDILAGICVDYDGFMTKPDKKYKIGTTYIMEDIITKETTPISKYDNGLIKGIPAAFSNLGIRCLDMCIHSSSKLVIMDELGRFEKNNWDFIERVITLLESNKIVIAVLKAEPIEYLDKIKARKDCIIYDLNQISYQKAYEDIISKLKILFQGEDSNEIN